MDNFRAFVKGNEKAIAVVVGVLVVGAVVWAVLNVGQRATPTDQAGEGSFFTADDGATYFKGNVNDIPPIDSGGTPAYGAHLATGSDGVTKVYYLDRFTAQARDVLLRVRAGKPVDPNETNLISSGRQFKRVGEKDWHSFASDEEKKSWIKSMKDSKGKMPYGLW